MKSMAGKHSRASIVGLVAIAALLSGMPLPITSAIAAEPPAAAEKNPPGDITDSQSFVTYASLLGRRAQE